jgi:hypothetical protein
MTITLFQAEHLPFEDVERLAYACDDNYPVSVKLVRAIAHRAIKAREDDAALIKRLEAENTALEVQIAEMEEAAE